MEWLNDLRSKTVGLDTAPLIYFIEENSTYLEGVKLFFEAMERGDFTVVTGNRSGSDILVHPLRSNNTALAEEYRDILLNSKLMTMEISSTIAEQAAQLRANYNMRTPDAIQISAALNAGATHFFTNDIRLPEIVEIQVLSLDTLMKR